MISKRIFIKLIANTIRLCIALKSVIRKYVQSPSKKLSREWLNETEN